MSTRAEGEGSSAPAHKTSNMCGQWLPAEMLCSARSVRIGQTWFVPWFYPFGGRVTAGKLFRFLEPVPVYKTEVTLAVTAPGLEG